MEIYTENFGVLSHTSYNLLDILRIFEIYLTKEIEKMNSYKESEFGLESSKSFLQNQLHVRLYRRNKRVQKRVGRCEAQKKS